MLTRRTIFRPGSNIVTVVLCLASRLGASMGAPGFGADGAKLTRSGKAELQRALLMGASRLFGDDGARKLWSDSAAGLRGSPGGRGAGKLRVFDGAVDWGACKAFASGAGEDGQEEVLLNILV